MRLTQSSGFTLIELLVVIAIIALLLAIIMPALSTAKEMAGAAVCLSNQRQTLTAWLTYAGENDSKMVSPNTNSGDWVGLPAQANGTTVSLSNCTAEEEQRGIANGLLYPYYEDYKLVHCPTDKRFAKPPTGAASGDGGYRTYSFILHAGWMIDRNDNQVYSTGWETPGWVLSGKEEIFRRVLEIKNAGSKFVLVEENDNRGCNNGAWVMDLRIPNLRFVDPFAVFHNMRSTLGFADGHAEKVVWKDKRTESFSERVSNGGHFYSDPAEHDDNEDLVWLYNHYPRN